MTRFLSVVTPTHNRAHTLSRVWESLIRQKPIHFEWVVVDDGSTDDTCHIVGRWQATSPFPLLYQRIPHSGRNAAVNASNSLVSGEFVTIMDSDDCFKDGAFETIETVLGLHQVSSDPALGGLGFVYEDETGTPLCKTVADPLRASYLDAWFVHGLRGEIEYVWKKGLFERLHYPEVPPPDHVPERTTHAPFARLYDFVYVAPRIGCRYRYDGIRRLTEDDHLRGPHRLTKPRRGHYHYSSSILRDELAYFRYEPLWFWKRAMNVSRYGLQSRVGFGKQFADLVTTRARLLWIVALPFGIAKYFVWKWRYGRLRQRNAQG